MDWCTWRQMALVYDPLKSGLLFCTEKKKITVSRPNVMSMYNRHIGGDNRLDENISL